MLDINEIKKDLYKSKNMAKFSHYQSGDLFYTVEIESGKYQFPISVVDAETKKEIIWPEGSSGQMEVDVKTGKFTLSEDLGITPFGSEVRGSELIRWIQKAMKNEQFIKVG